MSAIGLRRDGTIDVPPLRADAAALLSAYGVARAAPHRRPALTASGVTMSVLGLAGILSIGLPLLAAGATIPESAGAKLALLLYWPIAGAIGLIILRNHARRLAARTGVGGGPRSYDAVTLGFVVSLPALALLFVPVFFVGGYWATLAWPAAILTAIALRQRNNVVYGVAVALALIGLVQGLLAATPRGSVQGWVALGLQVAAGVALILGGQAAGRRALAA